MSETYLCSTLEALPDVASCVVHKNASCRIFIFNGHLGAGKTALIREMCRVLGCKEDVTSPTFSVINEYTAAQGTIYHMDLYRLKDIAEALDIGMEDYILSGSYCFIEWPEVVLPLLDEEYCSITISVLPDQTRKIDAEWVRA
jgi:tRNA threonylcarbamoyladenosine biosynthesis protein TsaE